MPLAMAVEALLFFQPFKRLTSNPLTLINGFDRCRGDLNRAEKEKPLGVPWSQFEEED